MRIIGALAVLLSLSCSSGQQGSEVGTGTAGPPGSGGSGGSDGINTGTGQRDCNNSASLEGCQCPTLDQQRACVVGTCPGTQICVASGSKEIVSSVWGACNASTTASGACATVDGAGGGTSGSSGGAGKGSTDDGAAGKGSTDDGGGGKGSTGDGQGGRGSTDDGQAGKGGGGSRPSLCTNRKINNEPEILVAYAPASGQTVSENGQIKVWVNDEGAPFISPNEKLDPTTGAVTTPGDRAAKAPDGYLWEPALYIAPATAETGGTPQFPVMIKGAYNYPGRSKTSGFAGAPIEPVPGNPKLGEKYTAEDIWDVKALGLAPGHYIGEFIVWDGDTDRAVGCIDIVITP